MIGYLEGRLRHKTPEYIIVDVGGVGYVVHVPLSTFYDLPSLDQTVVLNIHTHVREDAIQLFGFKTLAEKDMFLHLVTVNGVGPKLAVNILSGISADELRHVIVLGDHTRLKHIPGVGKKIAERIVLELRDKVKGKDEGEGGAGAMPLFTASDANAYSDAHSALINLGYRPAEADRALKQVQAHHGKDLPVEKLLKEALRVLA
ncbi:MAG: Holliday junction branch migration protein RuvA [Acidobacteriota bacterium]